MNPGWTKYRGKSVLVGRFDEVSETEAISIIDRCEVEVQQAAEPVLFLTVYNETRNSASQVERWKRFKRATEGRLKASAIAGLPPLIRALAALVNRDAHFCKTEQEGLDWLVGQ